MEERDFTTLLPEDLRDIQGIILLDYNMPLVRHFLVKIKRPNEARYILGFLANQRKAQGLYVTSSENYEKINQKAYCLNVGLTYEGLKALGLPAAILESFPRTSSFVAGAAARAWQVGDKDGSAPEYWWMDEDGTSPAPSDIHMLLSLYVRGNADKPADKQLADRTDELKRLFHVDGKESLQILQYRDGARLPDKYPGKPGALIHFGFRDGISQPRINGAPDAGPGVYKTQEPVPPGAFLFGYASQWENFRYPVPRPAQFGRNGSFAVFRVMQQHVERFDAYLKETVQKATAQGKRISEQEIAARLCGRSRDGEPRVKPRSDNINDFDYASDPKGEYCPFESHIRRTNPRGDQIAGNDAKKHPIIRRGMPYGPVYDSKEPDKKERGLLGLFIGVSIEDQFEFIMQNWVNKGGFRQGLPTNSADPFLPFIRTRGCAYCFLPSISALEYIASV